MLRRLMFLFLGSAICLGTIGCGEDKTATMPDEVSAPVTEKPAQQQMKPPKPPPQPSK